MASLLKLISLFCGFIIGASGAQLPSFITPCSRSLPTDQLSRCVTEQGRQLQPMLAKGLTELNLEPLDPLKLTNLSANAGTFTIKSNNVVVKGLKKVDIRELRWDVDKMSGHTKFFGNMTFLSDYETEGRVLLLPITGSGKLTVKMYDTEMLFKYKFKKVKDENGVEHVQTYDSKASQRYGNVRIHMSNLLGGAEFGETVNQVLNENWRELMAEVGPPYTKAIASKVHAIINKFYYSIPFDELFAP